MTNDEIMAIGYEFFVNYDDYFIAVLPMTFGKGRLVYCEDYNVENAWCYATFAQAILGMYKWVDGTEPTGWIRNPFDGRRREGGDQAKETRRP